MPINLPAVTILGLTSYVALAIGPPALLGVDVQASDFYVWQWEPWRVVAWLVAWAVTVRAI